MDSANCPQDHALMQDAAFASALRRCGETPVRLPGGDLLLHRWVCGIPLAMLPRKAPPADLAAQLGQRGLARMPVILSPDQPTDIRGAIRLAGARERAVLSLAPDDADARAALHVKWRNQLKRAENSALAVQFEPFNSQNGNRILRIETEQSKRRGYVNWPAALTQAFADSAPDQTHLATARLKDKAVAHMLFLTHGQHASYHIGHNSVQGRALNAHNLLLWQGARRLAALGFDTLDLGLIEKGAIGLNRFKLRTGASRIKTGGTWLYWRPFARRVLPPLTA